MEQVGCGRSHFKVSIHGIRLLFVFGLTACGKPATVEDCENIVRRITELELRSAAIVEPAEVKEKVSQTQAAFKKRTMNDCVGRRISEGMRSCIDAAANARQLVEECFQ